MIWVKSTNGFTNIETRIRMSCPSIFQQQWSKGGTSLVGGGRRWLDCGDPSITKQRMFKRKWEKLSYLYLVIHHNWTTYNFFYFPRKKETKGCIYSFVCLEKMSVCRTLDWGQYIPLKTYFKTTYCYKSVNLQLIPLCIYYPYITHMYM